MGTGAIATPQMDDREALRWDVEFLGQKAFQAEESARGDNWEFRATLLKTGATKTFTSGTEMGWFLDVRSYEGVALVDTAVPSPGTVVVTTANGFGVRSEHNVDLREACWEQDQEYAESVAPSPRTGFPSSSGEW